MLNDFIIWRHFGFGVLWRHVVALYDYTEWVEVLYMYHGFRYCNMSKSICEYTYIRNTYICKWVEGVSYHQYCIAMYRYTTTRIYIYDFLLPTYYSFVSSPPLEINWFHLSTLYFYFL